MRSPESGKWKMREWEGVVVRRAGTRAALQPGKGSAQVQPRGWQGEDAGEEGVVARRVRRQRGALPAPRESGRPGQCPLCKMPPWEELPAAKPLLQPTPPPISQRPPRPSLASVSPLPVSGAGNAISLEASGHAKGHDATATPAGVTAVTAVTGAETQRSGARDQETVPSPKEARAGVRVSTAESTSGEGTPGAGEGDRTGARSGYWRAQGVLRRYRAGHSTIGRGRGRSV